MLNSAMHEYRTLETRLIALLRSGTISEEAFREAAGQLS